MSASNTKNTEDRIVEIDLNELALIIAEKVGGMTRPEGCSIEQALSDIPDDFRQGFLDAADSASRYVVEQFGKMNKIN